MRGPAIARSYADALFELGDKHGELEAFDAALQLVAATLESDRRLQLFLDTPKVELEDKKRVVRGAFQDDIPGPVLNFLFVVLDKGRQRLIPQIAREYRTLLDARLGRVHAEVTLAREPEKGMEREIADELSRALGLTVVPMVRVDPDIIGGIIVRYGDHILDGSLRRRLVMLRRHLLRAGAKAENR